MSRFNPLGGTINPDPSYPKPALESAAERLGFLPRGYSFSPVQVAIDSETVKDLISAQLMLTQSMADLAESIRALAEAMGEPDMGDNPESMVMSRKR